MKWEYVFKITQNVNIIQTRCKKCNWRNESQGKNLGEIVVIDKKSDQKGQGGPLK